MAQDQKQPVERTLVLLKPDAVVRGFAGKIISRFEDAALKIVGIKMKQMDAEFTRRHYFDLEERFGPEVYNITATFMQQGPVIALVLEGADAVATVRKIVGSTFPNEAPMRHDPRGLLALQQGRQRRLRQGRREPRARLRQQGGSGPGGGPLVRQGRAPGLPHPR